MKKILILTSVFCVLTFLLQAQDINKIINAKEVEKIEKVLSSNEMRGRKTFTPDIDRAADFIASEFKKTGLHYWTGLNSYKQDFFMLESTNTNTAATITISIIIIADLKYLEYLILCICAF